MNFRKLISGAVMLTSTLALSGMGLVSQVSAAPLTQASVTLTSARSLVTSDYTFSFKVASTTAIQGIKLRFRIEPSNTNTVPNGLVTTGTSLTSTDIRVNGTLTGQTWTLGNGTAGLNTVTNATGTAALSAGDVISFTITNYTNTDATTTGAGTQCDSVSNSESCFILIDTYSDAAMTSPLDSSVVTFTTIQPISVTATVDPSLTMTITGVTSVANINSNDSNAACSGNDIVATATSIPFGNIRVGVHQCAQQSIAVATNALNGYKTYSKFVGSDPTTDLMKGTTTTNNIDPFTSAFTAATSFSAPNGTTANVNTGFLGERVKTPASMNPGIGGFSTSNFYGAPYVGSSIGNKIMDKDSSDDGLSPTYVTLKIQVNAVQPADTYSGTRSINVVPVY